MKIEIHRFYLDIWWYMNIDVESANKKWTLDVSQALSSRLGSFNLPVVSTTLLAVLRHDGWNRHDGAMNVCRVARGADKLKKEPVTWESNCRQWDITNVWTIYRKIGTVEHISNHGKPNDKPIPNGGLWNWLYHMKFNKHWSFDCQVPFDLAGWPRDLVPIKLGGLPHFQWPFQEPTDWRYLPYIRPIVQAYVSEYPHKIWPEIWYSTSISGSWNSHWHFCTFTCFYHFVWGIWSVDW